VKRESSDGEGAEMKRGVKRWRGGGDEEGSEAMAREWEWRGQSIDDKGVVAS